MRMDSMTKQTIYAVAAGPQHAELLVPLAAARHIMQSVEQCAPIGSNGGAVPIFLRLENNYELTLNSIDAETAVRRARRQCGLD